MKIPVRRPLTVKNKKMWFLRIYVRITSKRFFGSKTVKMFISWKKRIFGQKWLILSDCAIEWPENTWNQIRVMHYSMHNIFESSFRWTKTRTNIICKGLFYFKTVFPTLVIWWDDIKSLFLDSKSNASGFVSF